MHTALEQLIEERQAWREQRWRRLSKVNERCRVGWSNFCLALHREIVLHNTLGRDLLGIRRHENWVEIHRAGQLQPLLSFSLDHDNEQILYHSPLHQESVILPREGAMLAAFLGSLLVLTPDGHMLKFSYSAAAQYLLAPITGD